MTPISLIPGRLRAALAERSRAALASGAMQPILTEQLTIQDGGVRFLVRKVSSLARKDQERRVRARETVPPNPFLPPEPDLLVGEVSGTHLAVLNKFNVIEEHLLIVTRGYVCQEMLLDGADFAALADCMNEFPALGFYNGGQAAGASQPHKHLQLVPLPLAPDGPEVPVEPLLRGVPSASVPVRVPGLPFRTAFARLREPSDPSAAVGAGELLETYRALLQAAGLHGVKSADGVRQSRPYNLLVTARWMLLVPRSREHDDSLSVNALGFAGSLFVRNDEELERVRRRGPMAILKAVSVEEDPE